MAKLKIGSPNRGATLDSTSITPDLSHYVRNDASFTAGVTNALNTIVGSTLTISNNTSTIAPKLTIQTSNLVRASIDPKSIAVFNMENGVTNNFAYSVTTNAMYVSKNNADGSRMVTLDVDGLLPTIELSSTAGKTELSQDASANLVVNKIVKAVTPTDSTDKSQLVTIEYLEAALAALQNA